MGPMAMHRRSLWWSRLLALVLVAGRHRYVSFEILSPSAGVNYISDATTIAIAFEPPPSSDSGSAVAAGMAHGARGQQQRPRHPHQHHELSDERPVEIRLDSGNSSGHDGFFGSG